MIDLLIPLRMIERIVRRGVARAVSDGIRGGVSDGFQDALGLTFDVELSELPALEAEPPKATNGRAKRKPATTARR